MSQQGKRTTKTLLDFYSKKCRDDSTENIIVCSDVEAASCVRAGIACSSSSAARQFYRRISGVQPAL